MAFRPAYSAGGSRFLAGSPPDGVFRLRRLWQQAFARCHCLPVRLDRSALRLAPAQGQGIGAALLSKAKLGQISLDLWTFQTNGPAQRFYESHGFIAVEETDGQTNEEREPDVRYRWLAPGQAGSCAT
ncbi:GNAT family N-acetyltransferase [Rhizobium sp. SL86]|uniref:GNAT family N-acetyltransferase n=1 Tax=Rhizobium sp. SL86 TaxID=2995148 RepID=UPI002DD43A44|nr:GNAT family N-acetyltransferase [Rhizobium sp. SL86]